MFIKEEDLRNAFWDNYKNRSAIIKWQFEMPLRTGNADLFTAEEFQGNIQMNAFEFKLSDIKKAMAQAEANMEFVNRSWIVMPIEKEKVLNDKYKLYLKEKGIGAIVVEDGGKWRFIQLPRIKDEYKGNMAITKMLLGRL